MKAVSAREPARRPGNGPVARIFLGLLDIGALFVAISCAGVVFSSLAAPQHAYQATVTAQSSDAALGRCVKPRKYTVEYVDQQQRITESFPLCATGGELQVGQQVEPWRGASGHLITTPPQSIAWMTSVFGLLGLGLSYFCLRAAFRRRRKTSPPC